MIGSTLDIAAVVRSALSAALAPPGLYVAAAGAVLLIAIAAAVILIARRRGPRADVDVRPSEEASRQAAGAKILVFKLDGDDDGAVGRRIADALSRGLQQKASTLDVGVGGKSGDLDDAVRRARAQAAKSRAGVAIWGAVADGAVRLRMLGGGGEGPCEAYSLPADMPAPFEAALVALVAAAGDQSPALSAAAEQMAAAAPNHPDSAVRLRAVKARASLALHLRERDRARLDAALAATAQADPRRATEPLEWAEVQTLRAEALRRAVLGVAEPPHRDLSERVDAWRGAMAVWSEEGAGDRIARAEAVMAQSLLELADAWSDARGLGEAARLAESAIARRDPKANGADAAVMTSLTALLGAVHLRLGEREPRPTLLEAAERELRRALVLAEAGGDRARVAAIQDELARALAKLGERDRGSERLRAAAVIYRLSLADDHRPELARARARAALGRALVSVGERDRDAGAVDEAVAALRTASNSLAACGAQAAAAQARRALERAERLYGELRAAARATVDAG